MSPLTNSQVKKAGSLLRRYMRGDEAYQAAHRQDARWAIAIIEEFRASHANPLVGMNNSLRSALRAEGCPVEVTQRLKRMSTITDKLRREPSLALSKMQDIGGVRAVVDTVGQIRAVEQRIRKNRDVTGYSDYIKTPRASGYRGVHVVVLSGPERRQIEVQLRTQAMHDWAITVERLGSRQGQNLKQDGDTPIQRFMAVVSQAMVYEEQGEVPPVDLLRKMSELRAQALPPERKDR